MSSEWELEKMRKQYQLERAAAPPDRYDSIDNIKDRLGMNIKSCQNETLLRNILLFLQERRQEELLVEAIREQTDSVKRLNKLVTVLQKNQEQTEEVCEAMADENEDKAPHLKKMKKRKN
jgi:hypothetical protein